MHDPSNRRQRQYEAAKSRSCTPNPEPDATCSELSKKIDLLKNSLERYKWFDGRYQAGRHTIKMKELENRIDKLKEQYDEKCVECK